MHPIIKTILIVFFIIACPYFHQSSIAGEEADTAYQQANADIEAPIEDTTSEYDEDYVAGDETYETAPAEPYLERNFDKISDAASSHPRDLNNESWKKLTNDPAFQYDDLKEDAQTPPTDDSDSWWLKLFQGIFDFFSSAIGKGLTIFAVVMLIIILIARAFQLNGNIFFSKKDKKTGLNLQQEEEDYIPDNWEKEISDAAKAGNYRLALRYAYRYLLTSLQEKEMIQYQVAKTNYQYVYELSGTPFHKDFMKLTRDYEYAWYGGFEINESFYAAYYQMTKDIQQQLKNK